MSNLDLWVSVFEKNDERFKTTLFFYSIGYCIMLHLLIKVSYWWFFFTRSIHRLQYWLISFGHFKTSIWYWLIILLNWSNHLLFISFYIHKEVSFIYSFFLYFLSTILKAKLLCLNLILLVFVYHTTNLKMSYLKCLKVNIAINIWQNMM